MSISKIAILIERYKKGASVEECVNFFHPAQRELNELLASKHRLHLTAFWVFGLAFLSGFGICWILFVR